MGDIRNKVEKGYLWSSVRSGLPILSVDTWLTCRQEPIDSRVMLLSSLKDMEDSFCGEKEMRRRNSSNSHNLHTDYIIDLV